MKANPLGTFTRAALAAVLACGLMLPAPALGDTGSEYPPPRSIDLLPAGGSGTCQLS